MKCSSCNEVQYVQLRSQSVRPSPSLVMKSVQLQITDPKLAFHNKLSWSLKHPLLINTAAAAAACVFCRYRKAFKSMGFNETICPNTRQLAFGAFGIRAMAHGRLPAKTIEAARYCLG
jgi:hypothetical protein